jgi:hypothetical protein
MIRTMFGTAVGIALGFALAFGGFADMLIVAVFGAVGLGVAKVLAGDLDLSPYLQGRRGNR